MARLALTTIYGDFTSGRWEIILVRLPVRPAEVLSRSRRGPALCALYVCVYLSVWKFLVIISGRLKINLHN